MSGTGSGGAQRQLPYSVRFEWGLDGARAARRAAILRGCSSGRELIDGGFAEDVSIAAELDGSSFVALLRDGAFQAA